MKLEQQVINLEIAQKLKKLGVKQESLWVWVKMNNDWVVELSKEAYPADNKKHPKYSAFTVAELGEMLPERFEKGKQSYYLLDTQIRPQGIYVLYHFLHASLEDRIIVEDKTEANARAKMLIYLLKNKLLTNTLLKKLFVKN